MNGARSRSGRAERDLGRSVSGVLTIGSHLVKYPG
jgi:hypothetical protein